jgi:hypothetical protein
VYWAYRDAFARLRGTNLGLQNSGGYTSWFGQRGMKWEEFSRNIDSKMDRLPPDRRKTCNKKLSRAL